jgi:DNA-directed RNA polymerase specialized sigma subunit
VEHQNSLNCTFIAIEKNGDMDLRTVGDIIGVSFVRVKQIQDKAVGKINKILKILD